MWHSPLCSKSVEVDPCRTLLAVSARPGHKTVSICHSVDTPLLTTIHINRTFSNHLGLRLRCQFDRVVGFVIHIPCPLFFCPFKSSNLFEIHLSFHVSLCFCCCFCFSYRFSLLFAVMCRVLIHHAWMGIGIGGLGHATCHGGEGGRARSGRLLIVCQQFF